MSTMWNAYEITIRLYRVTGGIPKSPAMIEGWLKAKAGLEENLEDAVAQVQAELGQEGVDAKLEAEGMKGWTGFKQDDVGLYLEARQLKALFKEAANILKDRLNRSAFKSKVAERVFVHGVLHRDRVHLMRNGEGIPAPDQTEERPINVMTAMGPRTALKRADVVEDCTATFILSILDESQADKKKNSVSLEEVAEILAYAQQNGLGADRSQGSGQFVVESIKPTTGPVDPNAKSANDLLKEFRA